MAKLYPHTTSEISLHAQRRFRRRFFGLIFISAGEQTADFSVYKLGLFIPYFDLQPSIMSMDSISISKSRVRDYLAQKLANNIINAEIEDLLIVLRYNALGGFEFLSDEDLFENFAAAIPELHFVEMIDTDDEMLYLAVKAEHAADAQEILVDVRRALQII